MSLNLRVLGTSALAAVTLVSCGGEPKQAAPSNLSGEVDVAQLLDVLPGEIVTRYEEVSYNERTGETVISNLRFSSEVDTEVGVIIETLSVSGVDTDFLLARLNGTNFDEEAIVVDKLEASNISLFGVEKFYGDFFETYNEKVEDIGDDTELEDAFNLIEFEKLNFQIETLSLDDFELRPFLLIKRELEDETDSELLGFLQTYAAYNRAIGAQRMSMQGLKMAMAMRDAGELIDMTFDVPSSIVEGWHGGDMDKYVVDRMTFKMSAPIPEEDGDADLPFESVSMAGDYGLQMVEGLRLDKALSWLARREMPPTTETDLMSLGVWTAKDQTLSIFDKPFFSVESSVMDMSQFHWLIPTQISSQAGNLVYDIGGMMEFVGSLVPEDEEEFENFEMVLKVFDVLEQYDLSAPSMDLDFNWLWDAEDGPARISVETGLEGYGTFAFDLSGAIAGFDDWVSAVKAAEETDGEEVFEAFANQNFAFNSQSIVMTDRGGNDRLLHAAIDVAKAIKDDVPEVAVLAAYDVETLKLLASNAIIGGAALAGQEFPVLNDYAKALAGYVAEGGSFKVAMEPEAPVRMKTFRKLSDIGNPEDAQAFLEALNFTVEHTQP